MFSDPGVTNAATTRPPPPLPPTAFVSGVKMGDLRGGSIPSPF